MYSYVFIVVSCRQHLEKAFEKLFARKDKICWPGHGGPDKAPQRFFRALVKRRRARKTAIFSRIEAGDCAIPAIVANVYEGLDPVFTNAAASSVRTHIEDLVEQGLVATEGAGPLGVSYRPG